MFEELSARTRAALRHGAEGAERLRGEWLSAGREAYREANRQGREVLARMESEIEALGRNVMAEKARLKAAARSGVERAGRGTARLLAEAGGQVAASQPLERDIARDMGSTARDLAGKVWNAPNSLVGLAYGGAGHIVGLATSTHPYVTAGANAIQFRNNPFGGVGAITLGNTTTYDREPWIDDGISVQEHERQHTIQGQQLGPMYLPSNLAGGTLAVMRDGDWHGPSNWNERGPQERPPRPWSRGRSR